MLHTVRLDNPFVSPITLQFGLVISTFIKICFVCNAVCLQYLIQPIVDGQEGMFLMFLSLLQTSFCTCSVFHRSFNLLFLFSMHPLLPWFFSHLSVQNFDPLSLTAYPTCSVFMKVILYFLLPYCTCVFHLPDLLVSYTCLAAFWLSFLHPLCFSSDCAHEWCLVVLMS